MAIPNRDEFVDELQSATGDRLRSVATYDEDGYDFLYLREELRDRAENVADDVHQNLVLEGIGKEYLEDRFGAGDLNFTLHEFEELQAYHFVTGEHEGLFVGIDPDGVVENAAVRAVVNDYVNE